MMPIRRSRGSIPTSPTPADDVSNLTLAEVRDRLARNTRVLSSSLFSPSTSPASTSVLAAQAGPSRHAQPPVDPVRERLVQNREALLAREAELLAEGLEGMSMSPAASVKQESPAAAAGNRLAGNSSPMSVRSSGKQRALDTIRQGEGSLPSNAIQLPIDQTLSLGSRDYTTQTLDSFNHLTLSKAVKPNYDPLDENARAQHLARMNNFMAHKGDRDPDDEDEDDGDGGIEQDVFGFDDGEYEGDDDRLGGDGARHVRGTGERVDEFGEDEEIWREGAAEEYTLRGGDLDR